MTSYITLPPAPTPQVIKDVSDADLMCVIMYRYVRINIILQNTEELPKYV